MNQKEKLEPKGALKFFSHMFLPGIFFEDTDTFLQAFGSENGNELINQTKLPVFISYS